MLLDLAIPNKEIDDESVASFVRRRLGEEALKRVAQPMIGGIYTGDAEKLSIRATMPQFVQMEKNYGSIIRAMMQSKNDTSDSGARYSQFLSFRQGMETLTKSLESKLPQNTVKLNEVVNKISIEGKSWKVETNKREMDTDGVIITTPSYHAASLIKDVDPKLYDELASIEYASSAVVIMAYKREHIANNLDGFGFVVPSTEKSNLIACSYASNKFDGRAPDGQVILRAFVGGVMNPDICNLEDADIIKKIEVELSDILGIKSDPEFTMIERYPNAMPQYNVGHIAKVERIKNELDKHTGLQIAGNAYNGVGIPDSVHSGEEAAEAILDELFEKPIRVVSATYSF